MRIVVTGASGVVGRGVVLRLLSQGHDVVGVARRRLESWPSAASFVQGDIRDAATVRQAVSGAHVVVHCAWAVDPAADDPGSREINVGGTANVLDVMSRTGTRRIVLASSSHVYGIDRGEALSEDAQLHPVSAPRVGQGPRRRDGCRVRCAMGGDPFGRDPRPGRGQLGATGVVVGAAPRRFRGAPVSGRAQRRRAPRCRPRSRGPGRRQRTGQPCRASEITLGGIADALGRPTVRSGMRARLCDNSVHRPTWTCC